MRARDVVGIASHSVSANLGEDRGVPADSIRFGFKNDHTCALTDNESLPVQIEGLAPRWRHRRESDETRELQLLEPLGGSGDDHVGPPRANEIRGETDRVFTGSAR